jgi:P-type Ca2+ transporter type 2C
MYHAKETHHIQKKDLVTRFESDIENGLSRKQAEERLKTYGHNRLEKQTGKSVVTLFFKQFKSLVMILLSGAAIASFLIGEKIEAYVILIVIVITALIGLVMEYKAGESIKSLQKTIRERSKVLRDGKTMSVPTSDITPGDIVLLEEGDKVPADGRIVGMNTLSTDESVLTGESSIVEKTDKDISGKKPVSEQANMVFMGTSVIIGSAKVLVTATGMETEMGKISGLLNRTKPTGTPLEKRLEQTGRSLILLTLVITLVIAIIGIIAGNPVETMVKTAIALAIAAVPEGLPAAATITLAIGMKRMADNNALLRNLPAVETLGSTTVLCTDKTGTLTENQMTLKQLRTLTRTIAIEGSGYAVEGDFIENEKTIDPASDALVSTMLKVGFLCNESDLHKKGDTYEVSGDPTEGALIAGFHKSGMNGEDIKKAYERLDIMPFDPEKKYMVSHHKTQDNKSFVAVKGAPGVLFELCTHYKDTSVSKLTRKKMNSFKKLNDRMAKDSYRILALAFKEIDHDGDLSLEKAIEDGLVLLGLAGLRDPAKPGIEESIQETSDAGIKTIMLTGDQKETAKGIAKDIGLEVDRQEQDDDQPVEDLSKKELIRHLETNSIFSRVTPKDKLQIVEALQDNGEIVAMTGDGVNDAPALKKADIGVAMGKRGTSVARESADMILLDDRYQTIVDAVRQGRVIFDNIQKFIHYLLSCNLSEIVYIFLALSLGLPVPLVALQILWLNVVTGVFPALAMAWETPEDDVMRRPPIKPHSKIITPYYKKTIGFQGFMLALGPLSVYALALHNGVDLGSARTIGLMTLAVVHLLQVFNVRKKDGSGLDRSVLRNKYLIASLVLTFVLQLFAIYLPPLQDILETVSLEPALWGYVIPGALAPVVLIRLSKPITRGRREKDALDT